MPGHWWAIEELDPPDPVDPLDPVLLELLAEFDGVPGGELFVVLVEVVVVDGELLEAACATAAPPNAPSVASAEKTATLRRIGMPPLRFMDDASESRCPKPALTPV
ncbi:MAG TPA: hypothetical protein VID68_04565 [Solirubrobacteraceae bacterium]|jgi:hypothetical protein